MNNIKRMTESAMLSALFVVVSILFIGGGIFYNLYMDTLVPVLITLIYLKCGKRYSILSSVVSLIIIILVIGNVATGIIMSQGMVLGLICGYAIQKDTSIFDDLFISAIVSCIIMVTIDITFSGLTGYSFLTEFKGYMDYIEFDENIKQVVYCILVATLPLGTMIITYIGGVIAGKKLKLLNDNGEKKYLILRNFKTVGAFSYCSKTTTIVAISYIFIVSIVNKFNLITNLVHLEIIITSAEYIALYFILKDCYSIIGSYVFTKTKSKLNYFIVELFMLFMIFTKFRLAAALMIIGDMFIEIKYKYRDSQSKRLENIIMRLNIAART